MEQRMESSAKTWFPVTMWCWQRLTSRRACRVYSWGLASVVVALAILYLFVTSPRRNLDRFLKQVATVELGKTKLDDWRKQVEQARISNVSINHFQGQFEGQVTIGWHGQNSLLQKLRLAPQTMVDASVGFKNGTANEINISLQLDCGDHDGIWYPDISVIAEKSMWDAPAGNWYYNLIKRGTGPIYHLRPRVPRRIGGGCLLSTLRV